ncbi:MAG: hypothetical protein U5Q44_15765 [Dehalococcoidia bacterium]|nr:hypothetical protein [Dehalococcoidia bacterium]
MLALAGIGGAELVDRVVADRAREVGRPVEGLVVEQDGDAIAGQVEVELHGIAGGSERSPHAGERIGRSFTRRGGVSDNEGGTHASKGAP